MEEMIIFKVFLIPVASKTHFTNLCKFRNTKKAQNMEYESFLLIWDIGVSISL